MTEAEWNSSTDPQVMLGLVQAPGRATDRKLRLFVCTCGRRLWPWLVPDGSRRAVEVAEAYADGLAPLEDMARAWRDATLAPSADLRGWSEKQVLANEIAVAAVFFEAAEVVGSVAAWTFEAAGRKKTEKAGLCAILRDLFSSVLRPASSPPFFLTSEVTALAQAAYDDRLLPTGLLKADRLAALAQALESAGCADAALLKHLRSKGPHVRGCFALDALLGKA